jgi:hypothetical protein
VGESVLSKGESDQTKVSLEVVVVESSHVVGESFHIVGESLHDVEESFHIVREEETEKDQTESSKEASDPSKFSQESRREVETQNRNQLTNEVFTMSTTKVAVHRPIAILDLPKPVPALITFAQGMVAAMTGNAAFATPAPPLATVEAAIQDLQAAETAALSRVKGSVAVRNEKLMAPLGK